MTITVEGTRFGDLEIEPDRVLQMPNGLIGIPGTRYALIGDEDATFRWLQSLDEPAIALPVTDPARFAHRIELDGTDHAGIDDGEILVTVRAADRAEDFTVNLRAPIVVRDGYAWQVVNADEHASLRAPLFPSAAVAAQGR